MNSPNAHPAENRGGILKMHFARRVGGSAKWLTVVFWCLTAALPLAAAHPWAGGSSRQYSNGANWSTGVAPTPSADTNSVSFGNLPVSLSPNVVLSGDNRVLTWQINASRNYTISGGAFVGPTAPSVWNVAG